MYYTKYGLLAQHARYWISIKHRTTTYICNICILKTLQDINDFIRRVEIVNNVKLINVRIGYNVHGEC